MDDWQADAGVDAETWRSRHQFLQANLVHPLRAHRSNLFPHEQRHKNEPADPKAIAELEKALAEEQGSSGSE